MAHIFHNITAENRGEEVERVLGCSPRTVNPVLQKLRDGNIPHITYLEQILTFITDGKKKVSEVTEVIKGNLKGINNELTKLTQIGEIVKVRRGVYALPDIENNNSQENSINS